MSPVNINQTVAVKLTPAGWDTFEKWAEESARPILNIFPNARRTIVFDHYDQVSESHTFQLWELMQIFGSKMYNGGTQQFVNNLIEIEEEL